MSDTPNYKVMELQAENENLKDQIIKMQEEKIVSLESQIKYLESLVRPKLYDEKDVGSHAIAPSNFKQKPVIRTTSEVSALLERRSLEVAKLPVSAEDLIKDDIK